MDVLIGTARGLMRPDGTTLLERDITAMHERDGELFVLADGTDLLTGAPDALRPVGVVASEPGTCVLASRAGVFVGTAEAHLVRDLQPVESFEAIDGRDAWYTPWGGPPDSRSMTEAPDGTLFVGVHVGGIVRSRDGGDSWHQTIDIDADIHQVITHQALVMATGWDALHVSDDAGDTWRAHTDGFDTTYMRALAVCGDTLLVTAARGHAGGDVGIYRRTLGDDGPFTRCDLPEPVGTHNIDTHWLGARDGRAAFVTHEGTVFASSDEGRSWEVLARDLPEPRCLLVA